jgi:mannitol-1-phosphate 5-dehydrogenase
VAKTFVGFGFGPIQSGLFLLEAQASCNFERLIVIEVQAELVDALHKSGGRATINVAHEDGLSTHELRGVEIYNPLVPADVSRIVDAIATADEIATALPNIDFFRRGAPSPAQLLARGFERKIADRKLPRAVVYTAENHNHAAEALADAVLKELDASQQPQLSHCFAFLNTVIGKMSGVVTDVEQLKRDGLTPLVEGGNCAVLVEQFNRILISQVPFANFNCGIAVFQEKQDLLPFEEAKLFGHNAAHALLGFLANRAGLVCMHEAHASLKTFVEKAFVEESGVPLCRRHAGVDPLFTHHGWAEYVRDLMQRMANPFLKDRVDRVIRDPHRKLAWNDRFIGTMRLALEYGVEPQHYATGAAAAVELMLAADPQQSLSSLLEHVWQNESDSARDGREVVLSVEQGYQHLNSSVFPEPHFTPQ